jgi:hypothetical protein
MGSNQSKIVDDVDFSPLFIPSLIGVDLRKHKMIIKQIRG